MTNYVECRPEELPVAYYTDTALRTLLSQLAQFELQPNALIGLNLFLDDILFRLLKIVDEEGDGHDGTSRSVVQAFGYALRKLLPPSAVATIQDRAAERTAFVMMSQPREKRRKQAATAARASERQMIAALERFPALRRHCAAYLAGQPAEHDWEVPLVVLAAECLRVVARVVASATTSLVRRSKRNVIDVNELLAALSTDARLEPLIRGMPSGVWMAEVVHVQVADSRPDAGMMDTWRQIVRSHRTVNSPKTLKSPFANGHAQELRDFLHDPLAGLQQAPQQQPQQQQQQQQQLQSPSFLYSGTAPAPQGDKDMPRRRIWPFRKPFVRRSSTA
ncbi:hypothetical protein SYNPS1DRAFT_31160 [Syncephalis pseudoplumigaleata]|uniref:Uncharacterized protein n=1 Tax=Syncephalis pseudoplumigaleata TaxID=1712513 RepID=A0A4P9YTS3_9FUNG|nr:hypothetical protein SYNPS1DRAFT_31160 [Syncephalis pseudoplumigaleata]|eukprot:RKP23138.1 hypothetical protein SYNPS1DRAFT_31160 [Syncephalis pseudoplumigaleata]